MLNHSLSGGFPKLPKLGVPLKGDYRDYIGVYRIVYLGIYRV